MSIFSEPFPFSGEAFAKLMEDRIHDGNKELIDTMAGGQMLMRMGSGSSGVVSVIHSACGGQLNLLGSLVFLCGGTDEGCNWLRSAVRSRFQPKSFVF